MFNNRASLAASSSRIEQNQLSIPSTRPLISSATTAAGHVITCQNQTPPSARECLRLLERLEVEIRSYPLELQRQYAPQHDKSDDLVVFTPSCMDSPLMLQRQQAPAKDKFVNESIN